MPKNQVQFQEGISIPRFLSLYGTEEQYHKHLFLLRWESSYVCPNCGSTSYLNSQTLRLIN
ncbi:transposase [Vibrio aestuarianus]|uniref:transposase n=1 Tax=Vibrio aestuarianus TaxID=28171 RepID=UPI00337C276F|nr:hypothetical protein VAE122_1560001 [Vibrio aestuarianus]